MTKLDTAAVYLRLHNAFEQNIIQVQRTRLLVFAVFGYARENSVLVQNTKYNDYNQF